MEKNVFVVNSAVDAVAVAKAAIRNSGVIKFRSNAEREEVNAEENVYIVGGGKSAVKVKNGTVVDLSGATSEVTAVNVYKHFNLV